MKTNKADSSSLNNYLPLTAGADKKVSGDLYFDTSSGDRKIVLSNGAVVKGNSSGSLIVSSKSGSPLYLSANGETVTDNTVEIYTTLVAPRKNDLMYLGTSSNQWKAVYGKAIYGETVYQKDGDGFVKVPTPRDLEQYATIEWVNENFGEIDTISVNGVNQTITNKNVDITVPVLPENIVTDANYVHTDNNFTTAEKNKLAGLSNFDSSAIEQSIEDLQNNKANQSALNELSGTVSTNTSDITDLKNNKADSSALDNYLPLSGGTMTGRTILPKNAESLRWQADSSSQGYFVRTTYSSTGQEALNISTGNARTSIIFRTNGESSITYDSGTPTLHMRAGTVTINKLNDASGTYSLDVEGKVNATELYQNGKQVATIDDIPTVLPNKIESISINNTPLDIVDKNVDIPLGSSSTFGVLKVGTGLSVDGGTVSLNTSGLITDSNLTTKVESVVGTQSTLTTTAKTLVGAVNELDSELGQLDTKVNNLNALKVLNKGVIEATEETVDTVATNYIQTNYSRAPENNDGLIITIDGDKILYIYSSHSSKWVSAGAESIDISEASYGTKGILKVKSGTGLSISNGELSLNDLSGTYVTTSTAQDISGAKRFDDAQFKVDDTTYRYALTSPAGWRTQKRYLVGVNALNEKFSNCSESVYMENNKLFSNGSEVLNLLDNQTITGAKTFDANITLTNNKAILTKTSSGTSVNLIKLNSSDQIQLGGSDVSLIYAMTNIVPKANTEISLGSETNKFTNMYLSGTLSDGENFITVEEICKKSGGSGGGSNIVFRR